MTTSRCEKFSPPLQLEVKSSKCVSTDKSTERNKEDRGPRSHSTSKL